MAKKNNYPQDFIKTFLVFVVGTFLGALIFGLLIYPKLNNSMPSKLTNNIINLSATGDEKFDTYYRAQITAPSAYFITDDQMLSSYDSMGGMAPPRLILMKNYQLIPNLKQENYLQDIWNYNKNDCISIWSTGGFSSVDEWRGLSGEDNYGKSEYFETIKVGNRSAQVYKLNEGKGSVYMAYMPVSLPEEKIGISYFFMTCNENNKQDLVSVIKSIKFRKDLNY